jgi:Sortase domain
MQRSKKALTWIAVLAALAGCLAILIAIRGQRSAPQPTTSAAGRIDPPPSTQTPGPTVGAPHQHPLSVSPPRRIEIAAIHVRSAVIAVGKNRNGTLEIPQPGPDLDKAAWYDRSSTPGRVGPTVIVGHVDTTAGPSIFFDLGNVRPGNRIRITRADQTTVTFVVNGVRRYSQKSNFPTALVYGGDLSRPTLRIVTCTNFDHETRHYVGNLVVFAHMTGFHKTQT